MKTYRQANCHLALPADTEAQADPADQVSIISDFIIIHILQADPEDQADLEAPADQRHITQLAHPADRKTVA